MQVLNLVKSGDVLPEVLGWHPLLIYHATAIR